MKRATRAEQLIIPVYINEKVVLDMLAIIEDGFSMVSQVSYSEQAERNSAQKISGEASSSVSLPFLSKLLKIDFRGDGELAHDTTHGDQKSTTFEKVHTNVSLLSKLRTCLAEIDGCLKTKFDVSQMHIGDFIELEGELQKNPLIDYLDRFVDLFRMVESLSDKPDVDYKKSAKKRAEPARTEERKMLEQIKSFRNELEQSGTTDFIMSDTKGTIVLSAQNQYLTNDNISELLGGRFKVLGKVISVRQDQNDKINLLRKTTLSLFNDADLQTLLQESLKEAGEKLSLPNLITEICGPAVIVIPIAIYA